MSLAYANANANANARLTNCETRKLDNILLFAFVPSFETRENRETHTDIFARSEPQFLQNSREKNCESRLAVNPNCYPSKFPPLPLLVQCNVWVDFYKASDRPEIVIAK